MKTKIFSVALMFAALTLTACGSNNQSTSSASAKPSTSNPTSQKTSSTPASTSSAAPVHEHNWEKTADNAEEAGFAKTAKYKCKDNEHYALRWSAKDMNEEASLAACGLTAKDNTVYAEINADNIRLRKAENDQGTEALGTHVVYKVKAAAAMQNVGFEFEATTKSGFSVPVFDYVSGDQQQGYIKKADGTLELTTKRYGLRVNGAEVTLGEDLYDDVDGEHGWWNWNVKFNLQAGENTIDVYCLGGYRAYIENFQLVAGSAF